jgi:hypothetical protein
MNRRDLLIAAPAAALGGFSVKAAAAASPPARTLSAAAFGAVGDGNTDDTAALQKALDATFKGESAGLLKIEPGRYRVTRPLKVYLERVQDRRRYTRLHGISAYGAQIRSDIGDASTSIFDFQSDTIERFLLIEGLEIRGNGREGTGLNMQCIGNGRYIYNFCLRDVVVENCGGDGLTMIGNIFEGQIFNSYFRDNKKNGATLGHDGKGGILSAVHIYGCVFGGNGADGASLINKAVDVSFDGCYFLENDKFGLNTSNGISLLSHCGFENNHRKAADFASGGAGARILNYGTFVGCTAYSIKQQTHLVDAYIVNQLVMVGCTGSGNDKAKEAKLAKVNGAADASITFVGCRGGIDRSPAVEVVELGQRGAGAQFGAAWNSKALPKMGGYTLWVDKAGKLRIKNGTPQSDEDGQRVGV